VPDGDEPARESPPDLACSEHSVPHAHPSFEIGSNRYPTPWCVWMYVWVGDRRSIF